MNRLPSKPTRAKPAITPATPPHPKRYNIDMRPEPNHPTLKVALYTHVPDCEPYTIYLENGLFVLRNADYDPLCSEETYSGIIDALDAFIAQKNAQKEVKLILGIAYNSVEFKHSLLKITKLTQATAYGQEVYALNTYHRPSLTQLELLKTREHKVKEAIAKYAELVGVLKASYGKITQEDLDKQRAG